MANIGIILAGLLLLAWAGGAAGADRSGQEGEAAGTGILLVFEEQEPGVDAYATRMVLNNRYLRIDDGLDDNEFVLFDRDKRVIYSVSAVRKTILTVQPAAVEPKLPFEVRLIEERQKDGDLPAVGGKAPVRYRFSANEQPCYEVVAVPGLMPPAVTALREYRRVLSQEHAAHVHKIPAELQDACDLAMNVTAPARHLDLGFPAYLRSVTGRVRRLVDYNERYVAAPDLFKLPEGYSRLSVGTTQRGGRGGGVD